MAYNKTDWLDHVVERPDTYTSTINADGSRTDTPAPGEVIQQGTPMSATNFNNEESGIDAASVMAALLLATTRDIDQRLDGVDDRDDRHEQEFSAEVKTVALANSQKWPFNNSAQTVALTTTRTTLNYTVEVEILSDVANIGDVRITEKQLNGFKVAHTGSAASVSVKLTIKGGFIA